MPLRMSVSPHAQINPDTQQNVEQLRQVRRKQPQKSRLLDRGVYPNRDIRKDDLHHARPCRHRAHRLAAAAPVLVSITV